MAIPTDDNRHVLSRRALLQTATLASVALPAVASARKAEPTLRDALLLSRDVCYFNAANIGPAFRSVINVQHRGTEAFQTNPSREYRERYPVAANKLRARLGKRMGVQAEEIALVRNASEANTVAVLGLDLLPGDQIIVTEHNHQSTLDSWRLRAKREKLDVVILKTPVAAASPQEIVDAFAAAVTGRTRAIFVSHMTNVTGLLYPVAEIAQIARKRGAWLHVDGAQTFGWMKLDLVALGVDSFSGSTHKWLLGPLEGGVLYVRHDRQYALNPIMISHGYWLTDPRNVETAQKYEILGQRDDPKLAAIDETLDRLDAIGEAMIEARVRAMGETMRAALVKVPGVRLVGSAHPALAGPVMTVAIDGKDAAAVRDQMWMTAKVATALAEADGQKLIRFSPHLYNSADDIALVTDLLARS